MDIRSQQFLGVMIAIAAVAILAFIAFFINSRLRAARVTDQQGDSEHPTFWHEFILATVVIVVVVMVLVWQVTPNVFDWQIDSRPLIFLLVMLAVGVSALVAFVIALFTGLRPAAVDENSQKSGVVSTSTVAAQPEAGEMRPVSSGLNILGLLALIVAFLVLNWVAMDRPSQHALVSTVLYPAAIAVALVLLMDKATRAWAAKSRAETYREWLFCDTFVFLLLLALLNLRMVDPPENYQALFWDVLQVIAFVFVFWLVDRTQTRLRFLFAYLYLIALPILLFIWRTVQEMAMPGATWWESVWPVFILSIIFFVLELITVIASRETPRHGLSAIKDTLFVVLLGVTLLIAVPAAQS